MNQDESSELVESKLPCPDTVNCGSSDAAALYDDGHYYCFSCNKAFFPDGNSPTSNTTSKAKSSVDLTRPDTATIRSVPDRGLTEATCKKWGYYTNQSNGDQWATYCDETGTRCGYHVRKTMPEKDFYWVGMYSKKAPLYGQQLWSSKGGKLVCITEGELDAMSVSQAQGHRWPVVSLPSGATSAAKSVSLAIEWLSKFEKVVIWLDPDKPGRDNAQKAAEALPPGLAYIVKAPSDANKLLMEGKGDQIGRYIHSAEPYVPGGVVSLDSIMDDLDPPEVGIPWSHDFMNEWTYGRRYGEVYTFGAGTGVGKSDLLLQEMAHTIGPSVKESVALFSFENGASMTASQVLGKLANRRLHIPDPDDILWTEEDRDRARKIYTEECAKLWINDSRGSVEWDQIKARTRFLARSQSVKHVVFDNLTAMVDPENEKTDIEKIMAEAAGLAEELQVCVYIVSHLATPEHGSHEEGARVTIRQFKGSRSIGFWSFFMFGMERNQQADTEDERSTTIFRCLKDRLTGNSVGNTKQLTYDMYTGMIIAKPTPDYGQVKDDSPPQIDPEYNIQE